MIVSLLCRKKTTNDRSELLTRNPDYRARQQLSYSTGCYQNYQASYVAKETR